MRSMSVVYFLLVRYRDMAICTDVRQLLSLLDILTFYIFTFSAS